MVNGVMMRGREIAYVGDSDLTSRQTNTESGIAPSRADCINQSKCTLGSNGERLDGSVRVILVGRARGGDSNHIKWKSYKEHKLEDTLVRRMRRNPHWVGARCGIVEICQGIGIGIEQIRCDIVEITTGKNSKVDHGKRTLRVQNKRSRGCFIGRARLYTFSGSVL